MTNDNGLVLRASFGLLVQYLYSVALLTHQHNYSYSLNKHAISGHDRPPLEFAYPIPTVLASGLPLIRLRRARLGLSPYPIYVVLASGYLANPVALVHLAYPDLTPKPGWSGVILLG
jgi:hypothetical protein